MKTLTIIKPDDFHVHFRDGDQLLTTVPHCAARFARALVMPNLKPPVVNKEMALAYHQRIMSVVPEHLNFSPLMSLYLTDNTTSGDIIEAHQSEKIIACKLYPAGATTNSDAGVTNLVHIEKTLATMQEVGMPLCIHGEVTDPNVDIFDREKVFIENTLVYLIKKFPNLKIILEHITTIEAVEFVKAQADNVAATITAHHLLINRNDMLVGGIQPHHYCLPVAKRSIHQAALRDAATSGSHKFFLGTDSAPHSQKSKESNCGCAGIYTSHAAIELYAQVFEAMGKLENLEGFASRFGAAFYGLAPNVETITLKKSTWTVPDHYLFDKTPLIPFYAQQELEWQVSEL